MTLALFHHAVGAPDQLCVWLGIADRFDGLTTPITWRLSGQARVPAAVRPMSEWLIAGRKPFCSGSFLFTGLPPGQPCTIEVTSGTESLTRQWTPLPGAVPGGPQDRFNLLLLSCFHRAEDVRGTAGNLLWAHKPRPDLTIFAGDQVYLDLPTLRNFEDKTVWLESKFQSDYLDNWFADRSGSGGGARVPAGYPQLLSLGAIATVPDDHEYWNNMPFVAPLIQNSWTKGGRDRWRAAAERAFTAFQHSTAAALGTPRTIAVDPLDILLLDTRSQRARGAGDRPDRRSMRSHDGDLIGAAGRTALAAWADALVASAGGASPRYGVLVTGQSLFRAPAGELVGGLADFEFADYEPDYRFMMGQLERVSEAGLPVLCLTGDVHWGRVLEARGTVGRASIFEVISSPTSLVGTVGIDTVKRVTGWLKNLFGPDDPWPRHGDPDDPPQRFGTIGAYRPGLLQSSRGQPSNMRGNMGVMLRFQRRGASLDVDVDYIPLHRDARVNADTRWTANFKLQPRA